MGCNSIKSRGVRYTKLETETETELKLELEPETETETEPEPETRTEPKPVDKSEYGWARGPDGVLHYGPLAHSLTTGRKGHQQQLYREFVCRSVNVGDIVRVVYRKRTFWFRINTINHKNYEADGQIDNRLEIPAFDDYKYRQIDLMIWVTFTRSHDIIKFEDICI